MNLPRKFTVKLATTRAELHAAQRLRYQVFVEELGGAGAMVDHEARLERDALDVHADHMIVCPTGSEAVIGVYRLLRGSQAHAAGGFYSAREYDLSPLAATNKRLLELGRSCLHRDYRGGLALHALWQGLARYIAQHRIEMLFGVASFHGTDINRLAAPLSLLHHRHLAPAAYRVAAHEPQRMDLIAADALDRRAAMIQMPALIKSYLRLGGCVGEGAFVDHMFNTTDVCLILDVANLSARDKRRFGIAS